MSQNSTVVQDGTGAQVLTALNNAIDTINTMHFGATAPPDAECHAPMLWADSSTTPWTLRCCTVVGAPSTFVTLGQLTANFGLLPLTGGAITGNLTVSGTFGVTGNVTLAAALAAAGAIDGGSASPASAATLPVTGGNLLQPTGTTTITALGTAQAGAMRQLRFTTALQLTNSAALLLFGQNITTEAGDSALFFSLGGGNWYLHSYQRGDGSLDMWGAQINEAQAANITAAATTNLGTMPGNYAVVTNTSGATNISALGTYAAGARRHVTFSITGGSVSLTHNATSLILPGAANISVTDGSSGLFMSLGGGNWRLLHWQPNSLSAQVWTTVGKNTSYTVTSADSGKFFVSSASAPNTFSLPAAASSANMILGFRNANTNSATMTISANGSDKVEGVSNLIGGVGTSYAIICDGTAWYRMDTGIAPSSPLAFTSGSQVFTTVGTSTFTVPAGIYYIRVSQWSPGGGAGGNYSSSFTGGGAGSGAFATGIFAVIPGQTYSCVVGAPGVGGNNGASATDGTDGGTTSFGALLSCTGGGLGHKGTASTQGSAGTGGIASGSGTLINGAAGANGVTTYGGCGASAPGLSGGAVTPATGNVAQAPNGSGGAVGATQSVVAASVSGITRESGGAGQGYTNIGGAGNGGLPGSGAGAASSTGVITTGTAGTGGGGKIIVEY